MVGGVCAQLLETTVLYEIIWTFLVQLNFSSLCSQLSDFSQQLCERLEQLVLTFASYHLLCLDETAPNRFYTPENASSLWLQNVVTLWFTD